MMSDPKFILKDGLRICRIIEPVLSKNGLHAALAGSLLYKGFSNKDIDIFIYNHKPGDFESTHPDKVKEILEIIFKDKIELTDNSTGTRYPDLIKATITGQLKTYIIDFFLITK